MAEFSYKEILRNNHIKLVNELNPDLFIHMLEHSLGKPITDSIQEQTTLKDKTRKLLDVLCTAPADRFEYFCKTIAGIYPSLYKVLKGYEPKKDESDFYLKPFSDNLRKSVFSAGNKPDNEIDEPINLDTQFVSLTLNTMLQTDSGDTVLPAEYQRNLENHGGKEISINDILPINSSGSSTLIKGRAGVGKSTLIQYLIRQWAQGKWESTKTCVFLLNLRKLVHVHRDVSFTELLGLYAEYVVELPGQKQPSLQWLKNNAQNVVFFTDGIDELLNLNQLLKRTPKLSLAEDSRARPLDWCLNLMQKNLLNESTSVLVSRPFDDLERFQFNRVIDVCGLTHEKVMLFVEKNVSEDRKEIVKGILSEDPVLASVCSITFYCAAICKILQVDSTIKSKTLKTYSRITAYVIMRLAARTTSEECTSSLMSECLRRCLPYLGALAYEGLLETENDLTRLVFDEDNIRKTGIGPENMMEAQKTGLLTYTNVQDPFNPQQKELQAQFVHLSVQEFLAVSKLAVSSPDDDVIEEKVGLLQSERLKLSDIFAFGVVFDKEDRNIADIRSAMTQSQNTAPEMETIEQYMHEIFEDICSDLNEHSSYELLQCLQAAYESQRKDLAKLLGEYVVTDGCLTISPGRMTAVDMMALIFMLRESNMETLSFESVDLDTASARELADYVMTTSSLRNLNLNCKCTDEGMKYLCDGIKSSKALQYLRIDGTITETGIRYISDMLISPTSLTHLHLRAMLIKHEDMEYLCRCIKSPTSSISHLTLEVIVEVEDFTSVSTLAKTLKSLNLYYVRFGDEAMKSLAESIKCSKTIEELRLDDDNTSTNIGIAYLSDAIQHAKTFKTFDLSKGNLQDEGMRCLSEAVRNSTSFEHLKLRRMPITEIGMKYLSDALVSPSTLSSLLLQWNLLSNEGIKLLSNAIQFSTTLRELKMISYWITRDGIRYLSDAIKATSSIQCIELCYNTDAGEGLGYLNDAIRSTSNLVPLKLHSRKMTRKEVNDLRRNVSGLTVNVNRKDVKHLRHKLTRVEVHIVDWLRGSEQCLQPLAKYLEDHWPF